MSKKHYQSDLSKYSYDRHSRKFEKNDLLRQVRRTIGGEPVSDTQIMMMVSAIRKGLSLGSEDRMLELACGNGALAFHFFSDCKSYVGIDISEYMIEVAKEKFENPPHTIFAVADALEYLEVCPCPEQYNKILSYAAFQYFPDAMITEMLTMINQRFINVTHIFIGNLPDLTQAVQFYKNSLPSIEELKSNETPIGIWRTRDEFIALASMTGWHGDIRVMPEQSYCSSYRFDIVLTKMSS